MVSPGMTKRTEELERMQKNGQENAEGVVNAFSFIFGLSLMLFGLILTCSIFGAIIGIPMMYLGYKMLKTVEVIEEKARERHLTNVEVQANKVNIEDE